MIIPNQAYKYIRHNQNEKFRFLSSCWNSFKNDEILKKYVCVQTHIHTCVPVYIEYKKQHLIKHLYCHFYVWLDRWKGFLFCLRECFSVLNYLSLTFSHFPSLMLSLFSLIMLPEFICFLIRDATLESVFYNSVCIIVQRMMSNGSKADL